MMSKKIKAYNLMTNIRCNLKVMITWPAAFFHLEEIDNNEGKNWPIFFLIKI